MNALLTAIVVASYFLILMLIARLTAKKNDNSTFFTANRSSAWYLVAFGMIGTSISGITFISIPGEVVNIGFSYFQIVLGYFFGYIIIANVLLPLYYKLNLTSIYTYLEGRYGTNTYKTGAFFFLLSRSLGASIRLFLAAMVFQVFIFKELNFPFELSVVLSMAFILLYSIRGGIKTIVWTDTLQTIFLVASLIITIIFINNYFDFSIMESVRAVADSSYSKIFNWDYKDNNFFVKQFLSGMFITITMTGLDQDMMQKNLTCRNLGEAKKNMYVFSVIIVVINLLFLGLGALLYMYAQHGNIPLPLDPDTHKIITDKVFPNIATHYFPIAFKFIFLIGLTAATFSSTDSALAALTTSICVDFLGFKPNQTENRIKTRYLVHILMAGFIVLAVITLHYVSKASVIKVLFQVAGYTYGPLLGLYSFGLFLKKRAPDRIIPYICFGSPILTFLFEKGLNFVFPSYHFGFEIILLNGLITFLGLLVCSRFLYDKNIYKDKL